MSGICPVSACRVVMPSSAGEDDTLSSTKALLDMFKTLS